jgi:hypothetical protein
MADRERLLQPHQRKVLFQTIQEMEVHEDVEEDHQAPEQNEGLEST